MLVRVEMRRIHVPDEETAATSFRTDIPSRRSLRGKPSFLRFLARKCSTLSKTCREIVEQQAGSSIVSVTRPHSVRETKYAEEVFEALFNEGISKRTNLDNIHMPRNPRELLASQFGIHESDIAMMDRYKNTSPFLIVSSQAVCIVCGRRLCCQEACLAPYGCKGCTQRVYCSAICFGMDWPFHARFCISGQTDFLLQFLLNRIRCKCNLSLQLQNVARQATSVLGRGAAVIMFEHLEALKVFIKHNQDFSLEYYYSLQYIGVSVIQEKFFWFDSYNLMISLINSYEIHSQFIVIVLVKSTISVVLEWDGSQPFSGIAVIPYYDTKNQLDPCFEQEVRDPKLYFEMLIASTKWNFKARRNVCLCLRRMCLSTKQDSCEEFIQDALNHYYLTGRLKVELIESWLTRKRISNFPHSDWESSIRTSIV